MRERRIIATNIQNKVFRYVPRNRIVTNTFKVRSEDRSMPLTNLMFGPPPGLKTFPRYETETYFEPSNLSDFLQNSPPKANLITSLPELGYFNNPVGLTNDIFSEKKLKRKPSIENNMENPSKDEERGSEKRGVSTSDVNENLQPEKGVRRWSIPLEGNFENDNL